MALDLTSLIVASLSLGVAVVLPLFSVKERVRHFFPWMWPHSARNDSPIRADPESRTVHIELTPDGRIREDQLPEGWALLPARVTTLEQQARGLQEPGSTNGQTIGTSSPSPRDDDETSSPAASNRVTIDNDGEAQGSPASRITTCE